MADCGLPRPLLDGWLEGTLSPDETARVEAHLPSCEECRVLADAASLGVGLLLIADAGGAGPSAGFAERVMDRVRAEPARAGVDDDGPPADPRRPIPARTPARGRLLGLPRPAWAGVAAALAAGAAWMVLLRDPGTTVVPPGPVDAHATNGGSVAARDGGLLRWTGPFDGSLAGSVWVAKDAAVPTSAGELLHSPAPSSFLALLPEGGRLDAGPSSWLAVGGPGEAALLEGGFTGSADPRRALHLDTPAGRVIVPPGGEVEVSIGAPAGGSGFTWVASWAAARRDGVEPGRPLSPPPSPAQVVFARKGVVEVAVSGGPVRNTLERTTLKEGQSLVVLEGKAFLSTGVDDDGPPDSSRWMDGLPVPPGSRFFRRPVKAEPKPDAPPGPFGAASGPVRNTLERSLGGDGSTPAERAYALTIYESVGGVEAVAAAAKAVDDPAVEVRCAALRVLALNASADRPTALAGLRKLARDGDAFVARFAILALKTLMDVESIPLLRGIAVDDDAPPDVVKRGVDDDAPPGRIVAKVYALDALVALGDRSLLKEGAALLPEASKDPVLYPVLRQFVYDAMEKLPREELRAYVQDPRPGVKAAALLALDDFDLAEEALKSENEAVRLAGALVLLGGKHPSALDRVGTVNWVSDQAKAEVIRSAEVLLANNPTIDVPHWVAITSREMLSRGNSHPDAAFSAAKILTRVRSDEDPADILTLASPQIAARILMANTNGYPLSALRASLESPDSDVRCAALYSANFWISRNPTSPEVPEIISRALAHPSSTKKEAQIITAVLLSAVRGSGSETAYTGLLHMTRSENPEARAGMAQILGHIKGSPTEMERLLELLDDPVERVTELAALNIARLFSSGRWTGVPPERLFPSPSTSPLTRAYIAMLGMKAQLDRAEETLASELRLCNTRQQIQALTGLHRLELRMKTLDTALLGSPDPAVRIRAMTESALSAENVALASTLSDDPNLWVRVIALTIRAETGDMSARQQIPEVIEVLSEGPSFASRLIKGTDVANEDILFGISNAATQAIEEGAVSDAVSRPDEASLLAQAVLRNRGAALHSLRRFNGTTDEATQSSLLRDLIKNPSPEALGFLGSKLPVEENSEDALAAVAASTYHRSIGFCPVSLTRRYHDERHFGYFSSLELLSSKR